MTRRTLGLLSGKAQHPTRSLFGVVGGTSLQGGERADRGRLGKAGARRKADITLVRHAGQTQRQRRG